MSDAIRTCLYAADINLTEYDFKAVYESMPLQRVTKCDRLRFEDDKKRCVLGWALLVYSLCDFSGEPLCKEVLEYVRNHFAQSEKGKPYIDGIRTYFNISHSGDKVICAFSDVEVGCDVERKTCDCLKIAQRFFAENEYKYLYNISDMGALDKEFLRIWTRKEAFVKAKGFGIAYPFGNISFVDKEGKISDMSVDEENQMYYFQSIDEDDGYLYSICKKSPDPVMNLRRVEKIVLPYCPRNL